jgi:hypothetical protein
MFFLFVSFVCQPSNLFSSVCSVLCLFYVPFSSFRYTVFIFFFLFVRALALALVWPGIPSPLFGLLAISPLFRSVFFFSVSFGRFA